MDTEQKKSKRQEASLNKSHKALISDLQRI